MAMRQATHDWTVERLHRIPDDGQRYEIIDGELFVTPSPAPRHQYVAVELLVCLVSYCRTAGLQALTAPADVIVSEDTLVQPDVFVVPMDASGRPPATYEEFGRPVLVIEVLSPSTTRTDRDRKRRLYQEMRVPEYWIIDTPARTLERWLPESREAEVLHEAIEWQPVAGRDALVIDLVMLFRLVYGD